MNCLPPLPSRFAPARLALSLLAASAWLCTSSVAVPKAGDVVIEKSSVTAPDGSAHEFELGTIYVPENRNNAQSRLIGVGFARFKALQPTGAPPTFHLPGGPGGSYVSGLNLTKKNAAERKLNERQFSDLSRYRAISDVVYVDQRGCSDLGERLVFSYDIPAKPLDLPTTLAVETAEFVAAAKAAVAEYAGKGVDISGYTIVECAADVNDIRQALNYDRITLIGQSYGGQWTFATLRRHPGIVARAIISGVEPLDCGYDMPSHIYASMQRSWQAVDADPAFKPYLPAGGMAAAVEAIARRLEKGPIQVPVTDANGKSVTITLGRDDWRPGNPAAILAVYHGQYEEWAKNALNQRRARKGTISPLIGPLIDTGLAVTPERRHLLRTDPAVALLGQWNFDDYMATESIWPTPDVGDEFRREVLNPTPVLFVQGDVDLSTPMENLLHVQPYFPNSRTIIVHNGPHSAYAKVREFLPEATAAIMEFVRSGDTTNLPVRVTVPAAKPTPPTFKL